MNQGKRKDQIETSMKMVMGGLIGMIAILLICLISVVVESIL
jgi:hypothetical protein